MSSIDQIKKNVRVRFAPSPTGPLHIGGVRTALYNYLFAKKHQGKFILRIEDTDQARTLPGAEQYIYDTLQWLDIIPDESPTQGGPYTPYRQSERKSLYKDYALHLVATNKAYYAFDTAEALDAMRKQLKAAKVATPQYNAMSRDSMQNSLTLPQEEVKERLQAGVPYVIRIRVPRKQTIKFYDQIRGWVHVSTATLDDKVLMKSDGMPTYHLAHVVDDHLMKISHVIRGEEWLPSTPLHVLLHQYLGWEAHVPEFAHLPLLLKPKGHGKLSKRDAEQQGFPLFPLPWQDPNTHQATQSFREAGYFPAALVNFLALLGWNPGTLQEIFDKAALVNAFSLERVSKGGALFDIQKAQWFNQQYLKMQPDEIGIGYLLAPLQKANIPCTQEKARQICELVKERAVFSQDFFQQSRYFFKAPTTYDVQVIQTKWNDQSPEILQACYTIFEKLDDFKADKIKTALMNFIAARKMKIGQVLPLIRVAVTGLGTGPDLMKIMEIIKKKETMARIDTALKNLSVPSHLP